MASADRQEMTNLVTQPTGGEQPKVPLREQKSGELSEEMSRQLRQKAETAWMALSHVIDPEVGLDIVTMGLVYNVAVSPNAIQVEMTLTTKGCPMSAYIKGSAERVLRDVFPDDGIFVAIVWEPPWSPAMISREGLARLGR